MVTFHKMVFLFMRPHLHNSNLAIRSCVDLTPAAVWWITCEMWPRLQVAKTWTQAKYTIISTAPLVKSAYKPI
jgi:hypothetical protein